MTTYIRMGNRSQDLNEDVEGLSYKRLKDYMGRHHPRDEKNKVFGCCTDMGYLPMCCFNVVKDPHEAKGSLVPNAGKEEVDIPYVQF